MISRLKFPATDTWKKSLKPNDQKILNFAEKGLPPSKIAHQRGVGKTTKYVTQRLKELRAAARTEEEFLFSRKREGGNEKSSTVAKSSGGISHSFPDYRGLPSDEQSLASAALHFVKHSINITHKNNIVKTAISEIEKILENIKAGKHLPAKSFITAMQNAGFERAHDGGSAYLQINNISTARLSNHPATAAPFVIDTKIADVLITVKKSIDKNSKRLYSLELIEIKKLSEKGSSENKSDNYTDSINKLQAKNEKVKSFLQNNLQFSRKGIYTGSAADYDQPSLQYIGSGEGAQVYGWGLYESSDIEVATWYAKAENLCI